MNSDSKWHLCLQRFGEGGEGSAGADAGGTAPVAGEQNDSGRQSFDDLLKDPGYKADYDQRVQKAIKGRFKTNEAEKAKLTPMLQMLGERYGIQAGEDGSYDVDALTQALQDDDMLYEQEALERGMSIEQLKESKARDRELERLQAAEKKRIADEQQRAAFDRVAQQTVQAKQVYPGLDIQQELKNPAFQRLVWGAGVDVRTAFEVVHRDEIMSGALKYAAQKTRSDVASTIAAGRARPVEGAAGGAVAVDNQMVPSKLTKEQRENIKMRARRGERISF